MAKKGTIGARIVLEGAGEYKKSLKDIAEAEKVLASEMKKTQSQYKDMEDSEEALKKKHQILTEQIELQRKKYAEHQKMIEASAKAQQEYAQKTESLRSELEKEEKTLKELEESSESSEDAIKAQAEAVEKLKEELSRSEAGYDAAGKKMQQFQIQANNAEAGIYNLEHSLDDVQKELDQTAEDAGEGADAVGEIGNAAEEAGDKTSTFGDVLKANLASEVIIQAAKAIANGIKEIATSAIEVGSSFEASMSQVAATMGITASEIASGSDAFDMLTEAAKACGESTKYSASEAAQALNYLALAGYDAEKAAATLPKVLNLAAAGGLDLARASDLVTDAMAALGMETAQLDDYIDQMATTAQKSNTSVDQLGEATLVAAGAVSTAQMDLASMNAELGVLANNGIKGAEGGTHLRNVILSLAAPTSTAATKLNELNVETEDTDGNMRDLNDILQDLNDALSDMGSAERARAIRAIFNKTDISAVNALLKGTGGEFQNLRDQLMNCAGAAEDMAETMNDNLKGKITILQSTLEALGISAYEIFDEELKGGIESATDAVKRLNDSVKGGSMNASLNKLADAIGNFIERGADLAEEVLPKIIDGAAWCIDNFETIISLVTGIVAANTAMNTVVPIINAARASWIAYKTAEEGATIAQWAMNTAMSANPIGLIVTALAGVTAAMIAYSALTVGAAEDTSRLSEEQRKMVESAEKVSDSVRKSAGARAEEVQNIDAQKNSTAQLVRELNSYTDAEGKVVREQERAKLIIAELNTLLPDMNLYYDEQTQMLSMSTEEIERNTQALWAQAEAEAYQEQMTELMRDRIEVETEMAKMEEEVAAARDRQTDAQNRYHDALNELLAIEDTASIEYMEQQQRVEELNQARMEEATLCSEICGPYNELENRLSELDTEYEIINGRIAETDETMEAAGEAAEAYSSTTIDALRLTEEEYEALYDAVEKSIQGQISLFDEYKAADAQNKEDMLKNMSDQVAGMEEWANDMEDLARRGIDEGLLQTLAEMGPAGAGYVKEFLRMTGDELQQANDLFERAAALPAQAATDIANTYEEVGYNTFLGWQRGGERAVSEVGEEMYNNGSDMAQRAADGFTETIDDNLSDIEETGQETADAYMEGMEGENGFDAHSPSRRTEQTGVYVVQGLIQGIMDNITLAEEAAKEAAQRVCEALETAAAYENFYGIGVNAAEGFAEGIRDTKNEAVRAAEEMADAAAKAVKGKLQISSPSKVFGYFGEMSAEGFAEGFESYLPRIDEAMTGLMPEVHEQTNSAVNTNTMNNSVNINVYGAEGQSVEELAQAVNDQLTDELNMKEASWR